ncbi:hypothetical protein Nepgr_026384 [Nepenthes gracilis]|uniref:Uncharacterized protein n=1 Tax=Nepenthes gracilis TaxID=150966 RepID=A0AAD3Y2F1_NEPGR|nr:hypothetical protein Nepgr_026384 [Nepenthes gracilis]
MWNRRIPFKSNWVGTVQLRIVHLSSVSHKFHPPSSSLIQAAALFRPIDHGICLNRFCSRDSSRAPLSVSSGW